MKPPPIRSLLIGTISVAMLFTCIASAQTAPATGPVSNALRGRITQIVGHASVMLAGKSAWETAKVGMLLDQASQIRTLYRTKVFINVDPDITIVVDSLTTVMLATLVETRGQPKVDVGMPYGRSQIIVEQADVKHDLTLRSGGATLSVAGSKDLLLQDYPGFAPIAIVSQPSTLRDAKGRTVAFGSVNRKTRLRGDRKSAAEDAKEASVEDPAGRFAARGQQENVLIAYLGRVAPGLNIQQFEFLRLISDPNFTGSAVGVVPTFGQLQVLLSFEGVPLQTRLVFTVVSPICKPKCEVVSEKTPAVPSGGVFEGSGQVGKNGFGSANVNWPAEAPGGTYKINLRLSKGESAKGFLQVTKNAGSTDPSAPQVTLPAVPVNLTRGTPTQKETVRVP